MRIRIKRFDRELPLPRYMTAGAAAFDLVARTAVAIPARSTGYIPLNIALEVPDGHTLLIAPRSSTHKKGLIMANSVGIIDPDFRGDGDEIHAAYHNQTDREVRIERGERIAQGLIKKIERVEWDEVDSLGNPTRGGFGTTGENI